MIDARALPETRVLIQPWVVAAVLGAFATGAHAGLDSTTARGVDFGLTGVAVGAAILIGLRLHRPTLRAPWLLFLAADVLFVASALVRPSVPGTAAVAVAAVHVTSGGAYLCSVAALLVMVRHSGGPGRDALLDGLTVATGVGALVLLELSVPALTLPGRPLWQGAAEALYPLYDLAMLVGLLLLGATTSLRLPSYRALVGCLGFLLAGDVGYAWLQRTGASTGPAAMDLPFLVSSTLLAVTVLHPSMTALGHPAASPGADGGTARPGTGRRMMVFLPTLLVPAVLLVTIGRSHGGLEVLAIAMVIAPLLLVLRTREALRAALYAQRHDPLSGLPTRDVFVTALGALLHTAQAEDEPVWVAVLELDDFRQVVRSWGHATGDAVIRLAGDRLRAALPTGTPFAHLGGDVFAAVLRGPSTEAMAAAEVLRRSFDGPHDVGGLELVTSVSVGVAGETLPADPRRLLADADTAMNRARGAGGNRVCRFEPAQRAVVQRRAVIEQALRHAPERDELFLVYQPVVDLPTGRVIGAEALLRWTHPELGDLPPGEFIPIAEETGLVEPLGAWVLEEACRRLSLWDATGLVAQEFTMAINVSTRQLRTPALAVLLHDVIEKYGLNPHRVVLEVTESAMHEDQDAFVAVLNRLRGVGVQISVDDFGTGYSSLSYLRRLPVTSVKLDRSLVENVAVPPGDAIARAVQAIAQAMDLVVIAEGVENEAQRDALRSLGIAQAQGWLWGRPVLPKDFLAPLVPLAAMAAEANEVAETADQATSTTTGA